MEKLLSTLKREYPHLTFIKGVDFCWSPVTNEIMYCTTLAKIDHAKFTILHELSHALLGHCEYKVDFELLQLEIAAWEHAKTIAAKYGIEINDDYIQSCLDSYRDWIYKRSICPRCGSKSMQSEDPSHYRCFNCHNRWYVANSKFCRTYRQHKIKNKTPATIQLQTLY
ncbi:MAG TPA: hypothetical protein VLG47_06845 [Candidatus Saccharimonadales bacterium]|nr:hypothetical protein [Candidatus Saccharimonadales bacterium]